MNVRSHLTAEWTDDIGFQALRLVARASSPAGSDGVSPPDLPGTKSYAPGRCWNSQPGTAALPRTERMGSFRSFLVARASSPAGSGGVSPPDLPGAKNYAPGRCWHPQPGTAALPCAERMTHFLSWPRFYHA